MRADSLLTHSRQAFVNLRAQHRGKGALTQAAIKDLPAATRLPCEMAQLAAGTDQQSFQMHFRGAILQQGDEESVHSGDVTVGKLPLQVGAAKCWTNKPDSDLQVLRVLIKVRRRPSADSVRGIMVKPGWRW